MMVFSKINFWIKLNYIFLIFLIGMKLSQSNNDNNN